MLRPADALTVLFSLFLLILTAFFYKTIPSSGYLMLIYSSLIFFQLALTKLCRINSFLMLTRDIIFPVMSVLIIFDSLGLIVHSINPQDIDHILIRLDYLIFAAYPTVEIEKIASPVLTDLLQAAYSTYYFLPVLLGVIIKIRGQREDFEKTLFLMLLCFYLSYIGYILFPALGPRYTMNHLHETELSGFLVSKTIQDILNLLEGVKRDAFPSGHTAIALTVLILAKRYVKWLFWCMLPIVILLVIATVYCRYHYVVDVIAGIALTLVTLAIGEIYYKAAKKQAAKAEDS
ncbi:MAG: phosphatase PAP2 family protein [Nitrospirae bacterium]|nr:phosphatase PAP2 family protein [Nitrospirota bacterium]